MPKRIQVIKAERKEFTYDGGRKSVSFSCQCIVMDDSDIGVLRVPEALAKPHLDAEGNLPRGTYELSYSAGINWKSRDIEGKMSGFEMVATSRIPGSVQAEKPKA